MGTRAAFFIGDARDPESRVWLGCVGWDGYPDGLPELCVVRSEVEFRIAVELYSKRDDFAPPTRFPYPWDKNLFLTDYVYSWHEGEIWIEYDRCWIKLADYEKASSAEDADEAFEALTDALEKTCENIVAPGLPYDGSAPDSIMIIST